MRARPRRPSASTSSSSARSSSCARAGSCPRPSRAHAGRAAHARAARLHRHRHPPGRLLARLAGHHRGAQRPAVGGHRRGVQRRQVHAHQRAAGRGPGAHGRAADDGAHGDLAVRGAPGRARDLARGGRAPDRRGRLRRGAPADEVRRGPDRSPRVHLPPPGAAGHPHLGHPRLQRPGGAPRGGRLPGARAGRGDPVGARRQPGPLADRVRAHRRAARGGRAPARGHQQDRPARPAGARAR